MFTILVVDDEEIIRTMMENLLQKEGYEVITASDGQAALERFTNEKFDLVITDLTMPRMDGMELLREIRAISPDAIVFIITAYGTLESAIAAMREGAYDYIVKPFIIDEILHKIRNIFKIKNLSQENIALKSQLQEKYNFPNIVGKSDSILQVLAMIKKISIAKSNVLISGESGTGKELVARAIHNNSPSKDGPFLGINCGAIPENLLESELFGYKKGAFTGAYKDKEGLFVTANNGTLFLDEIGEMPLGLQIKILRTLEERVVHPIGSNTTLAYEARIISATNKDLSREVEQSNFREDLYYRMNVVEIRIPPLRERRDDIPLLAKHFIDQKNEQLGLNIEGIDDESMECLYNYRWKGNIRELENVIERAMILSEDNLITMSCLPKHISESRLENESSPPLLPLKDAIRNFEMNYIQKILAKTDNDKKQAARLLDISLASLYRKLDENN